jgi:hypothetical protein
MLIRMGVVAVFAASSLVACGGDGAPATYDYSACALDRVLVDSSHLVRIGDTPAVEFERAGDPRAATFAAAPIDADDRFDGVAEGELALVGQARTDLPEEWTVHATASDTDGSLSFTGPCSLEFDRQFAALQAAFGGADELAFLARMVDEALQSGRGADLRNVVAPAGWSAVEVTDALAPRWEGRVRVASLTAQFSPPGLGGIAGISSGVGFAGQGIGAGVPTTSLTMLVPVATDGPAVVLLQDESGTLLGQALDLTGTDCRDATGMFVTVDLQTRAATCRIAELTEVQQAEVTAAQAALVFDRAPAIPAYSDSPPTQE